ncbi:MAG: hypothetical protein JNL17_10635 [Cyclobacteriaceae bacterium]|nr:hypothetical protein [Cyclobacteriaceae bacterium]
MISQAQTNSLASAVQSIGSAIKSRDGFAIASATAGSASTAISVGLLQTVPGVGQVLGAIALISGLIAKGRAKKKAFDEQRAQVEVQNSEMRSMIAELDVAIAQIERQLQSSLVQINQLGSLGSSWFDRTFRPGKTAEREYNAAATTNEQLKRDLETRMGTAEQLTQGLVQVLEKLTNVQGNRAAQNAVLFGLLVLGIGVAGYYGYLEFSKKQPILAG